MKKRGGEMQMQRMNTAAWVQREMAGKERLIRVARGEEKADLVLKNARYLNVFSNEFCQGDIAIAEGKIAGIGKYEGIEEKDVTGRIVCPGFIDAHIHLESSLVEPAEFARAVLPHGTTTVITDPHEIANVMGTDGIQYMLEATDGLPLDVEFMLPSCVPATPMDESGAELDYMTIDPFFSHPRVLGLAEMMDYMGVVQQDPQALSKILASQSHHKKIDGHAPGLSGKSLMAYIAAGVYSDHECSDLENALEKLRLGQFIMIREGTAAQNLHALLPLLKQQYDSRCMFATDDKHPNDLLFGGHVDYILREAIGCGADPVSALKASSFSAARYFLMNNKGAIAPGYLADLVILEDLSGCTVLEVYKNGKAVYADHQVLPFETPKVTPELWEKARNTFHMDPVAPAHFAAGTLPLIGMVDKEIISRNCGTAQEIQPEKDILKMAAVERHQETGHIGLAYLQGYGLKKGAVATSVAHDSHNIIAVGASDEELAFAVEEIRKMQGGIVVVEGENVLACVPLPVAGIISDAPLEEVNAALEEAKQAAYQLGVSSGIDPFMTLSFMALPVIPSLRLTTKGVFDVERWEYIR